jgi:hypothetical protein
MPTRTSRHTIAFTAALASLVMAQPSQAYKWPGEAASPGGAIAAKVIGTYCEGVLSTFEQAELDAYIAKAGHELDRKAAAASPSERGRPFADFAASLTATYSQDLAKPGACSADAEEEARDMLHRVRAAMTSSSPLFLDENDPKRRPDIAEASSARLVADKCRADFTAADVVALDVYVAGVWQRWVSHSAESDARVTMDLYAKLARDEAAAWTDAGCSSEAITKTKATLTRLGRS